ncbi:NADH:ubiquinone oxidoreductase B8 subunit [Chondrus crispus]|uniref:NADH:ubiquinone oxidoreductase B8 subunit n=1 Tax=Chondrus crispus TaxID=2769 RepID=R7QNG8_CHOCR|nr:NADH:ubiquinone oxidoreductase B8 subunit [Chondrus crispus]CDF39649.1 NADH:ubiquinone oxidoreductase B8 subunit [Chondrus crispus]|eukprot:XP_005709943.1 NADH:ubiquinone oxidoreductase B8 subunit [Chondrus crispus]
MSWRARLSLSLNELRVVYCAKSASSKGTRDFIKNNYKTFKVLNPGLPIYMRPSDGAQPHVAARYERGVYEVRDVTGLSEAQVLGVVQELEAAAPHINSTVGGGIGGNKFKLADIV